MTPWGKPLFLLLCAPLGCAAAASSYEPAPFSHYQPILDRMPFGALPPAFNPDAAADLEAQKTAEEEKAEQQQVAKQLAFSALNVTPRGTTAVGFTDRSVNPPESYYLEVGASAHGWTVLAADYAGNWAQFEKDGVTITMHLDKGLIDGPPSAEGSPQPPVTASEGGPRPPGAAHAPVSIPGLVRRHAPSRFMPAAPAPETADAPAKPYLERLRERRAQEHAKEQAARTAAENATRESLQELARKIAQDELAKREQENAAAIEELRMQQELQAAEAAEQERQRAEEQKAAPEAPPEPEPEPEPEQ
jgi:hypothetical protein